MNARRRRWLALGTAIIFGGALLTSSCQRIGSLDSIELISDEDGAPAQALNQPSAADLASALDSLEHGIESDGSIVAEQPSVWGQARLTMYRQEFETTMAKQLGNFQATLQGSLSRSDQAYAADALALSYAAQAGGLTSNAPLFGGVTITPSINSSTSSANSSGSSASPSGGAGGSSGFDPTATAFNAFAPGNFSRTGVNMPSLMGFVSPIAGGATLGSISLEPTVYLDQMKRYIDHLHELRRMSDGDDTADAPGYSLNLIRIPVSVLPGRRTQQRYGGEITLTLKPHLNPELLPMTFRNLVENDLLDEIGVPLTYVLNDQDWDRAMADLWREIQDQQDCPGKSKFELFVDAVERTLENDESSTEKTNRAAPRNPSPAGRSSTRLTINTAAESEVQRQTVKLKGFLGVRSSSRLRTGTEAFPPSQVIDIYGQRGWAEIVCSAYRTFIKDVPNKDIVHYPDVQSFLQQEIDASYSLLKLDQAREMLWNACDQTLVGLIHGRNTNALADVRSSFERSANLIARPSGKYADKTGLTAALAWAVVVDSALLNQRLIEDMTTAPASRGGNFNLPPRNAWLSYFLPDPDPQAREAFNEYVRCRWPIHVFSLDPEDDSQNIADSYSMRREMQLAISLAFASGNLSANNMFQFARRLETDMETISLNKTTVGFSHGTDVFGWRFYPRFQSPDTESNCKAFLELVFGGPNRRQLLRERQLEPGIRECVAIVLMPSFVPYADVDASSNWFALDNPRRKLMNSKKAIRLGEQLKMIENCSQFVGHAECCRDGDIERLLNRAKQLESRLPLQSMSVQVPYENTIGGFSMFNTGVTNLAPELLGWYGSPAINLDAPTTLFLIGTHFSLHQTSVIVGGQAIPNPTLLSRQVMSVTVPQNAITLIESNGFVAGGFSHSPAPFLETAKANCYDPCPLGCSDKNNCSQCPGKDSGAKECEQTSAEDQPASQERMQLVSPVAEESTPAENSPDTSGHVVLSPAGPGCNLDPKDPKTWIQTPAQQTVSQDHGLVFPNCAMTLHDPAITNPALPAGTLSLTVTKGIVVLGHLNGLTTISGTNGSASLAVRGNLNDLQQAVNGLTYIPNTGTSGVDVLTITLQGSGINSPCTVNVAINVQAKAPTPYLYVDVQMATPYGTTTHMLIPAAHLTQTGSGPAAASSAGASTSAPAGVLPQWTSTQLTLGYVNKGVGIAACDPPSYSPSALAISLGPNYVNPTNNAVSLALTPGGGASGAVPAQTIALTASSWDPVKHVLTITGSDLATLATNLMTAIQYQFGARQGTTPPPQSFTLSASVTDVNNPSGITVNGSLTVNLVRVPVTPIFNTVPVSP
jgi:hypothetical protein